MSIDPETFQDPDFQQELFVRFNEAMATFQENERQHPHKDEYEIDSSMTKEFEEACDKLVICHECITPEDMSELEIDPSTQQATEEEEVQEQQNPNPDPEHIHNIYQLRNYWDDRNREQYHDEIEAAVQRYFRRRDMIEQAYFEAFPPYPMELALQDLQFGSPQTSGNEENEEEEKEEEDDRNEGRYGL